MEKYDLLIVGSGIVGSSLAFYSSKNNKKVLIVEKNFTGFNSSGNAQGGLAPYLGTDNSTKKLHDNSYSLHKEFKKLFRNYTEINPNYDEKRLIHIIDSAEEKELLLNNFEYKINNDLNFIKNFEPKLKKINHGVIIFDDYMEVDSFNLTNSFLSSSLNMGAKIITHDFKIENLQFNKNKLESFSTNDERFFIKNVAITAGPWTSEIAKNNDHINVKPLKGQLLKFKTSQDFNNSISWGKDYATKKKDDLLWIGTTEEDVKFTEGKTEEAKVKILNSFNEMFNGFDDLNLIDHTACFRPYSENNIPVIKKSDKLANIFYGSGAGRNGIKLGPGMGEKLYQEIFN